MIVTQENPFGQVVSISGMNMVIEINKSLLQRSLEQKITIGQEVVKLFVGTVGDIFLIGDPTSNNFHYGIFEEVKLVSEFEEVQSIQPIPVNTRNNYKAVAIAKVIGYQDKLIRDSLKFQRGVGHYPRFNSKCYLLTSDEKKQLFSLSAGEGIKVGNISGVQSEEVSIHVDKFLGKHSVILGSTGSGKSSTVASILQKVLRRHKYSHVLFFDLHNEYSAAFQSEEFESKVNKVAAKNFTLPYWLLNFEEFQSIFLGDIDNNKNSDGIRITKEQILVLKEKEHKLIEKEVGVIEKISINSPLYFNIDELIIELVKLNKRTFWKSDNALALNEDESDYRAGTGAQKIERPGKEKDSVIQDPNYYGKLNQIIEKLYSIRYDRRFNFLFPLGYDKSTSIRGYIIDLLSIPCNNEQKQLTILDLSRIPSEITPIIIGVLGRICFEFKLWEENPQTLPLYLVFEEAHNYIPKETTPTTKLPKKYLERIAKEGRKYGITQLIISQRPSDLSTTIVSQCSNFFVLRVTNPEDQAFIKHILPDHLSALTHMIPFFQNGEALIVGECVPLPIKGIIDKPTPPPNSNDVSFSNAWSSLIEKYDINHTLYRWWEVKEND
ncbi:ATP-binding protein [Peribacillus frigoritolerans]|uniref:ATP-binding protein n=1 Tax=Peribacillus frigoritolerans TaxID=450367 RepID=UPI00215AF07C|nr:ATP-binding protein [Peribacillus frigoritolerans]MCR8868350.1 ATP-binding protein [Peribacillus frigoritolerans]